MENVGEGNYAVPVGLRMVPFCAYKVLTLLFGVHRMGVSLTLCLTEQITAPVLLAVIFSVCVSLIWILSVWNPADTAFIWSNMDRLLIDLSHKQGREFRQFDQLLLCIKVQCILALIPICTVCLTVVNGGLYGGLPTSWFRLLEALGGFNVESTKTVWVLLACLPLEAVTAFGLLLTPAFVCITALTILQTTKTYGEEIRKMDITDLKGRQAVERMFVHWQIFARMTNDWLKLHTVPIMITIAGSSTMFLFLTIRFTNAPFFIYICFPIIAFTFLILLALTMYEAVSVTQISQQVLSNKLLSFEHCQHLRMMLKGERKVVTLRAKAFRPLSFPIGSFTDIKYSVMADIWEEILNQLLFLLSF